MRAWLALRRTAHRPEGFRSSISSQRFNSTRSSSRNVAALLADHGANAQDVSVQGWIRSVRKQKKVAFAAISDGSTTNALQAVLQPEDAVNLSTGTAVRLHGNWTPSMGKGQSHELQVSRVSLLGENDAEHNPLQPKFQTPEYLRTIPHLRVRTPVNTLLLRLRSQLIASLTRFFENEDFVQTHTPIITSSDCEGAGEVFTISPDPPPSDSQPTANKEAEAQHEHFFRKRKYLTVSAQLHLEALSQAVDKVWTLSPTFRAEKSDTPRHLSEFYMLEAEMCFTQDLDQIMNLVENMLRSVVNDMSSSRTYAELTKGNHETLIDTNTLQARWEGIAAEPWPRITYAEAIQILETAHANNKATFQFPPSYNEGLQAEHEKYIARAIGGGKPVFVSDYPRAQKPFYMLPSPASRNSRGTDETVACFDLLVPDLCELAGGSLREHRLSDLADAMRAKNVVGESLEWYQDLRKYGSVPHGGFGLGFDRLLCYLSGVGNVRDIVAFPRWYGRCDC